MDHLGTEFDRMLHHDYLHRHNELLKCIHIRLGNTCGIINRKKLREHKVDKFLENNKASTKVDPAIQTDIKTQHNKPDIVLHNKINNEIIIVF